MSAIIRVKVPGLLVLGDDAGGLYTVYIDGNGKANYITGSSYDANTKMLRFATVVPGMHSKVSRRGQGVPNISCSIVPRGSSS